jgi:hypothetical protein
MSRLLPELSTLADPGITVMRPEYVGLLGAAGRYWQIEIQPTLGPS